MLKDSDVVIVSAVRTPIGSFDGKFVQDCRLKSSILFKDDVLLTTGRKK